MKHKNLRRKIYITVRKRERKKKVASQRNSTLALYNLLKEKKITLAYIIKGNNIQKRGGQE